MTTYFKINYYFEGEGWSDFLKEYAEAAFMLTRSEYVKTVTPHLGKINRDFEALHGAEAFKNDDLYLPYMAERLNAITKEYYKQHPKYGIFYGDTNPETGDFRLRVIGKPELMVNYDMTPVKVKEKTKLQKLRERLGL